MGLDADRLVFIDETAAKTNMTPQRGWALKGKRLVDRSPHGHWITVTFIAALRATGLTAPHVVSGAMNGERFLDYIVNVLAPTLRAGDIVVMDNLQCHKSPRVRAALAAVGATPLYLPPYSPDLNPIEQVYSKSKAILRRLKRRTVPALQEALLNLPKHFPPAECARFIAHAGYHDRKT